MSKQEKVDPKLGERVIRRRPVDSTPAVRTPLPWWAVVGSLVVACALVAYVFLSMPPGLQSDSEAVLDASEQIAERSDGQTTGREGDYADLALQSLELKDALNENAKQLDPENFDREVWEGVRQDLITFFLLEFDVCQAQRAETSEVYDCAEREGRQLCATELWPAMLLGVDPQIRLEDDQFYITFTLPWEAPLVRDLPVGPFAGSAYRDACDLRELGVTAEERMGLLDDEVEEDVPETFETLQAAASVDHETL